MSPAKRRGVSWALWALTALVVSGLFLWGTSSVTHGQLSREEIEHIVRSVGGFPVEPPAGAVIQPALYGLTVAAFTALLGALGVIWRKSNRLERQLRDMAEDHAKLMREADASTLQEARAGAKDASATRQEIYLMQKDALARIEKIDNDNSAWRGKGIKAVEENTAEARLLREAIERGGVLVSRPTQPGGLPGR